MIFIHSSASYVYVYCRLYVHTRFTNARKILSMIVCFCGFPGETSFTFIPYPSSIRVFLEYLASHIVSTLMTIIVDLLSLQYVISNHPVTGSIMLTHFNIKGFLNVLRIFRDLQDLQIVCSKVLLPIT